ncbi:hypothetical protein VOLCADRAFT_88933 [Volvox carteri f. nagariensis]|uniref:F-box domain-containing protein n=1 Tax=Volvox carteri f. nagariensis TaxID=3068 RepID=D8TQC5_VOLCA|nr:uncharacterized protein VOLCADRAFT_88933 [Volvox carteri f. nagariensis]EFJ50510.1 hypothetical protein VOLCADRAFT_88933 [Volvox carteri f. nagariensis]|eukprot:XP_002948635.1 hypothetical protein VOLCADRAFT_88933 [Volvox carteri f. nagariensis]
MDVLTPLPWPCHARIMKLLPLRSRLILSTVSKHFNDLVQRDALQDVCSLDVNDLYGQQASGCLAWALRRNLKGLRSIAASGHSCLDPLLTACQLPAGQALLAQLKSLHLDSVNQLQDKHISVLLAACPNLEVLALPRCGKLTDASAIAIGSLLPGLRVMCCRDWAALTDGGVVALALGCRHLEDITLDGCFRVGSEALAALVRSCPRLRRLSIAKSYGVTDTALAALGEYGSGLEDLCLRQCPRVAVVSRLGSCTALRAVDLSGCANVTGPNLLAMLSGCGRTLTSLQLNGCVGVDGEALGAVGRLCPGLQTLNVRGLALNDGHLRDLASSCTTLHTLCLAWCTRLTEEGLRPLLARNPELEDLDIEALYLVTDTLLTALAQYTPHLDRLGIRMCHRLTPAAIAELVGAVPVRSLLVSGILDEADTSDLVRRVKMVRSDCNLNWQPPWTTKQYDVTASSSGTRRGVEQQPTLPITNSWA